MEARLGSHIEGYVGVTAHDKTRVRSWLSFSRHKRFFCAAGAAAEVLLSACAPASRSMVPSEKNPGPTSQTVSTQTESELFFPVKVEKPVKEGFVEFRSAENNYRITYPENWTFQKAPNGDLLSSPDGSTLFMITFKAINPGTTLDNYKHQLIASSGGLSDNMFEFAPGFIGGRDAWILDSSKLSNVPAGGYQRTAIFVTRNLGWGLSLIAYDVTPANTQGKRQLFNDIARTFNEIAPSSKP